VSSVTKVDPDQNPGRQTGYADSMDAKPIAPICPCCRKSMKLVRTISHLGGLPELFVYYCAECRQAETLWEEQQERAA
jgi:hypothetical protein